MENSEVDHIRDAWELVLQDKLHHGVEMFVRLFDRYPETKAKFPRLSDTCDSPEAMRKSVRMRAHAGRVVIGLTSIIEAVEDMELVDENIFLLGDSHNRRKVLVEDMQKFADILLDYLADALPSDVYPPDAAKAFKKLADVFVSKISQHLDN